MIVNKKKFRYKNSIPQSAIDGKLYNFFHQKNICIFGCLITPNVKTNTNMILNLKEVVNYNKKKRKPVAIAKLFEYKKLNVILTKIYDVFSKLCYDIPWILTENMSTPIGTF